MKLQTGHIIYAIVGFLCLFACQHRSTASAGFDEKNKDLAEIFRFSVPSCRVRTLHLDPQFTSRVVIQHGEDSVMLFDLLKRQPIWNRRYSDAFGSQGATLQYPQLIFGNQSESIYFASSGSIIELDARDGSLRRSLIHASQSEDKPLYYSAIAMTRDRRFLATVGSEQKPPDLNIYKLTDLESASELSKLQIRQLLQIWDVESGKMLTSATVDDAWIRQIGFDTTGTRVHTTSFRQVGFYDTQSLNQLHSLSVESGLLGSSGYASIAASTITPDLRFVAVRSLSRVYLISSESGRVIGNFGWSTEGLSSILAMTMNADATEIWLTDLDGMYLRFSLPDGEYLEGGHSSGVGRGQSPIHRPQGIYAINTDQELAIESTPPDRPRFPIESDPTNVPDPNRCDQLRVIKL